MKYSLLLILFLKLSIASFAQENGPTNSGDLIQQCTVLYDSGEYKKALSILDQINRSDTNYVKAIYLKAINCEADSQYNRAIKYCEEGLLYGDQGEWEPDLYNTMGNTYRDMGDPEKAMTTFDFAISKYPSYSLLYFNKGIVLQTLKRFEEAEQQFQKTLLITPYMYSAHFQLGLTALREGKVIPAFLSFIGYLLMNPEGKYWSRSITLLNEISKATDDIAEYKNKRTAAQSASYQEVEDIVFSKIALDKGYKPIIKLDDAISRQIQAVFEKLDFNPSDHDFWMQYYLPYYKQVFNDGSFEVFINYIFSKANVESIHEFNKKRKKDIDAFTTKAAEYFNLLRSTRELVFNKRKDLKDLYFHEDGKLIGKGTVSSDGKLLIGPWTSYFFGGNIKGTGNFNEIGEREGEWRYYFFSGKLKSIERYKKGKLEGKQERYYDNGNLSSIEYYSNNELEGLDTEYSYGGYIKSTTNYKAGKKNGEEKIYHSNGVLKTLNHYVDDKLNGECPEYYNSGKLKEINLYVNDKQDGNYKSYFENGGKLSEGFFKNEHADGEWNYYYENGKQKEKRQYVNNQQEGPNSEYYENGQISVTGSYRKGKINGEETHFDTDGKLWSKFMYDNGILKSVSYFDKAGKQLAHYEMQDNKLDIIAYSPEGIKKSHFSYDKKNDMTGPDTSFYPSGKIDEINIYDNGQPNGLSTSYHLNGNKKSEVNMTDGTEDGLFTNYYTNGKIQSKGWIVGGQPEGEWVYFDQAGNISSKSFFLNGDLNGYRQEFYPDGKLSTEQQYFRGWLKKLTQFDSTGKILIIDSFPKASGKYALVYPNGHKMLEVNYINGDYDGAYKIYFFDGSLENEFYYKKGLLDSTYKSFWYGGTIRSEGKYSFGKKTGTWKTYFEDGKIYTSIDYVNDKMNGKKIYYYENGNKEIEFLCKDDLLDGQATKYDEEGNLEYQEIFDENFPTAYTYLGKDGKLLPLITLDPIKATMQSYFANGKPARLCSYSDGEKNGVDLFYHMNGQLRSRDTSYYGVNNGVNLEYYPNGTLKSEYAYKDDILFGVSKEYYSSGLIKKEMSFYNGMSHGPTKYFDEKGKLIKTIWYYYDKLLSVKNEK